MKIDTLGISPETAGGRAPADRDGTLAQLQWRRALEKAQWELRSHYRQEAPVTLAPQQESSRVPADSGAVGATSDTSFKIAPGRRAAEVLSSEPKLSSSHTQLARIPGGEAHGPRASHVDPPRVLGNQLRAAIAQDIDALETEISRWIQAYARVSDPKWTPVSTHVWIDGNMLSVTLRDARITAQEAERMYHQLRERLAEIGFELHQLTINGHVVIPTREG
jgi:hypothetical protein